MLLMKRDITLYQQVAMIFEKKIRNGELPPGSKLPPTSELAKQLGVNPETIQLGLKLLIDQGLISRAPKRGTFVKEKLLHKTLGLVFPNDFYLDPAGAVFPVIVAKLAQYAAQFGWQSRYFIIDSDEKTDMAFYELRRAIEANELGAIAEVTYHNSIIHNYVRTDCRVPRVIFSSVDYTQMLECGLDELEKRGCRKVDLLFAYNDEPGKFEAAKENCKKGIEKFRKRNPDTEMIIRPRFVHAHRNDGYRYIKEQWNKKIGRPDGLLVASDIVLKGVWYGIMELGIKIPEELALVSHVNKGLRPMMHIPLTALEVDPAEIARISMDAFLARLEGKKVKDQKVKVKLIKGVTC